MFCHFSQLDFQDFIKQKLGPKGKKRDNVSLGITSMYMF